MQLPSIRSVRPRFFAVIGGIVLRPRVNDFYQYGGFIHSIMFLTPETEFKGNMLARDALTYPNIMCEIFTKNEFAKKYLPAAVQRAKTISERISDITKDDWPERINDGVLELLKEAVIAFESSLQDELERLPIFACEEEKIGNLSVDKLLKGASNGYPSKTKDHLTSLCLTEIDEAGRCLVFDRGTAAGFHLLRSVELAIRQYLTAIPSFTMPPLNRQNWGEYLKLLKENGAGKDVTDHLYNIKDNYRNPLMHPEDTLGVDEAVSLFGVAQSMNEMLIADMKKRGLPCPMITVKPPSSTQ